LPEIQSEWNPWENKKTYKTTRVLHVSTCEFPEIMRMRKRHRKTGIANSIPPKSLHSVETEKKTTFQTFSNFFNAKALDVISDGAYKKYIVSCREAGEPWALQTHIAVQQVQTVVRKMSRILVELQAAGHSRLAHVCTAASNNINPPQEMHSGWHTCYVSGLRCQQGIVLHVQQRSETQYTVHKRFQRFLLAFWFVSKIEQIVRNLARVWVDDKGTTNSTVKKLAEEFQEQSEYVRKIFVIFCYCSNHVETSMAKHLGDN
jgi:hypothetical protein